MAAAVARKSNRSTERNRNSGASSRARSSGRSSASRRTSSSGGRPTLQVFDQVAIRNRARRRYAIVATFVVLLAGLFAVALIQAQLVANQHRLDSIRAEIATSEAEHTRLERLVEEASAPSAIIEQAMSMGLVRAVNPVYLAPSEPAVAVPVPISLGEQSTDRSAERIVAAADPDLVSAGVEAALQAVATATTDGATVNSQTVDGVSVDGVTVDGERASDPDNNSPSGLASIAGTTATSGGLNASAGQTRSETRSAVADVVVESALPVIQTVDSASVDGASVDGASVAVESTSTVGSSSVQVDGNGQVPEGDASGPVWAGAVAVAGSSG